MQYNREIKRMRALPFAVVAAPVFAAWLVARKDWTPAVLGATSETEGPFAKLGLPEAEAPWVGLPLPFEAKLDDRCADAPCCFPPPDDEDWPPYALAKAPWLAAFWLAAFWLLNWSPLEPVLLLLPEEPATFMLALGVDVAKRKPNVAAI